MSERTLTEAVYGALPPDYQESPEQSRALQSALSRLDYRERLTLELLHGLNGNAQLPPKETAGQLPYYGSVSAASTQDVKRIGIGLQAMRSIEAKALRKLRHPANKWINHCPWCHRNGTMNCKPIA